jgi:hypothetical protein
MPLEPTQGGATDGAGERDAPQESGRDAPPPTDPAGSDSLDGLRATLTKERSERERLQREVAKLVAAQTKVDDAKKSDVERLTAEIARITGERDQLAAAASARVVRDALIEAAERAHTRRPSPSSSPTRVHSTMTARRHATACGRHWRTCVKRCHVCSATTVPPTGTSAAPPPRPART